MKGDDAKIKMGKGKQSKRGPTELRYQIQGIYFLPPDTPFPILKRDNEVVTQHMQKGYGFPSTHFKNGKFKRVSLPLKTSNSCFKSFLKGLYPFRTGKFTLHTVSKGKELAEIPSETNTLSWLKSQGTKGYQGVLVLREVQTVASVSTSKPDTAQDASPTKKSSSWQKKQKPAADRSGEDPASSPLSGQSPVSDADSQKGGGTHMQSPDTAVSSLEEPWRHTTRQQRSWHLQVDKEVYDHWHALGIAEGLKNDTEIASYLVKLYESAKNGVQVISLCAVCQTSLTLICAKCPATVIHSEQEKGGDGQGDRLVLTVLPNKLETKTESQEKVAVINIQDQTTNRQVQPADSTVGQGVPASLGDSGEDGAAEEMNTDSAAVLNTQDLDATVSHVTSTQMAETQSVLNSSTAAEAAEEKTKGRKSKAKRSGKGDRVCDVCGKSFQFASLLREHRHLHTGEKPHVCKICNAAFRAKRQLKQHQLAKHTSERPYLCPICGRSYNLVGSLNMHIQRHKAKKSFVCNVCGASFYVNAQLIAHGRVHTDERPFLCTECGSAFRERSKLKEHMRIHTGEKPYKCTICPAAFGRKKNLICHVRRHKGEKPFKCEVCSYACVDAAILKVHARTHTGEKPYVCQVCGTAYAYNVALRNHMKHHTDHEMYMCGECGQEFKRHIDLLRHKQGVHNNQFSAQMTDL